MKHKSNPSAKNADFQSKIQRFVALIEGGLANLAEAGKLLVEMVDENPDTFEILLKENKTLKEPNLWSLYYTGKGRPVEYLLSEAPGIRKLRSLPPEIQAKIPERIPVVEQTARGSFRTVSKPIGEVTAREAARAITVVGVASQQAQKAAILAEQALVAQPKVRYVEVADGIKFYEDAHMTWAELEQLAARGRAIYTGASSAIKAAMQKNQLRG